MSLRLQYWTAAPVATNTLIQLSKHIAQSGLNPQLLDLVYLRVSQINGCAFCVDLHYRDALEKGEDPRRLNGISAWRETPFFTDRERAALAWAETLTRVEKSGAPDELFEEVRAHFDDEQLAHLTFAIAAMNASNRIAIGFRRGPTAD